MIDFNTLSATEVLALTIIGEARGEPIEGQVAVGCVIRNRLHIFAKKYKTYNDVCLEPKQFSCWEPKDPNKALLSELRDLLVHGQTITDPYLRQCFVVAHGVYNWDILDNTKGATNYITWELFSSPDRPQWATEVKKYVKIANQVYFNA